MKHQFRDYILDMLQPHGPITAKSLFGGYGIYYNGLIIGIIVHNELYFKVDAITQPQFEQYGSSFFMYEGKVKTVQMPYMKVPDEILENRTLLPQWIEATYKVSSRNPKKKRRVKQATL